jgi:uncharacterized protein YjbI with pentapeptide repeats
LRIVGHDQSIPWGLQEVEMQSHINLTQANFTQANLTGAVLNNATMTQADWRGADWRGADLRQAKLCFLMGVPVNIESANVMGTMITFQNPAAGFSPQQQQDLAQRGAILHGPSEVCDRRQT